MKFADSTKVKLAEEQSSAQLALGNAKHLKGLMEARMKAEPKVSEMVIAQYTTAQAKYDLAARNNRDVVNLLSQEINAAPFFFYAKPDPKLVDPRLDSAKEAFDDFTVDAKKLSAGVGMQPMVAITPAAIEAAEVLGKALVDWWKRATEEQRRIVIEYLNSTYMVPLDWGAIDITAPAPKAPPARPGTNDGQPPVAS